MRKTSLFVLGLAACSQNDAGPPTTIQLHITQTTQYLQQRAPGTAAWVAFQDGDGDWTQLTAGGSEYSFTVGHARYGVAVACADASLAFQFRTVGETTDLSIPCAQPLADGLGVKIGAQVDTPAGESGEADLFVSNRSSDPVSYVGSGGSFSDAWQARSGTWDMGATNGAGRFAIQRDLDTTTDHIVALHSVDGWPSFGPSVTLGGDSSASLDASYLTAHGTFVQVAQGTGPTLAVPTIPDAERVPGELYVVHEQAQGSSIVDVQRFTDDPTATLASNGGFASPPILSSYQQTVVLSFTPIDGALGYSLSYEGPTRNASFDYSAGWLGSSTVLDVPLTTPADGSTGGWTSGGAWSVSAYGDTAGFAGEKLVEEIGSVDGVVAQLAGVERWVAFAFPTIQ